MTTRRAGTRVRGYCLTGHHVGKATDTSAACPGNGCTCPCHGEES